MVIYAHALACSIATFMLFAGTLTCSELHRTALTQLALEYPVRVCIKAAIPDTTIQLSSKDGFVLYTPHKAHLHTVHEQTLAIERVKEKLTINGIPYPAQDTFILPIAGRIAHESIEYDGYFAVHHTKEKTYVINHLDLEDYIAAVLPHEGYGIWPDEFQKALSIVCRSFAIAKMEHRKKYNIQQPYDLTNTILDQVYKGYSRKVVKKSITAATKGLILQYDDKPVMALHSSVCGGVVPAFDTTRHELFAQAPYLARPYACTFCKPHKNFAWSSSCSRKEIEACFKKVIHELGSLEDLTIPSYNNAGVPTLLSVKGPNKTVPISMHKAMMACHKIKSRCCTIAIHGDTVTFKGNGRGHHLGMCQWGAYHMVKQGYNFIHVLSYYYPTATIGTIFHKTHTPSVHFTPNALSL